MFWYNRCDGNRESLNVQDGYCQRYMNYIQAPFDKANAGKYFYKPYNLVIINGPCQVEILNYISFMS